MVRPLMFYPNFTNSTTIAKQAKKKDSVPFYYYVKDGDFSIAWINVAIMVFAHVMLAHVYYIILTDRNSVTFQYTFMYSNALAQIMGLGVVVGAHRMWAHRSFKAVWPLRFILMFGHTIAGQYSLYNWVKFHRTHHKYSDTDGDPHNTRRGFFFAHIGWTMRRRHPENKVKTQTVHFEDLWEDPLIRFQHNYFPYLYLLFSVILPMSIPIYFWNENWYRAAISAFLGRQVISAHVGFFVNSAAHMFGQKPFNSKIEPNDSPWVSIAVFGEGSHNYHHAFPTDYRTSEFGRANLGTWLLNIWYKLGLVYDMKVVSQEVVERAKIRAKLDQDPEGTHHVEYF